MKHGKRTRIFWIVVSVIMIIGMIIFTVMPFLNVQ